MAPIWKNGKRWIYKSPGYHHTFERGDDTSLTSSLESSVITVSNLPSSSSPAIHEMPPPKKASKIQLKAAAVQVLIPKSARFAMLSMNPLKIQSVSGRNKCFCSSSHVLCYGCLRLCATHNSFASYDGNIIC